MSFNDNKSTWIVNSHAVLGLANHSFTEGLVEILSTVQRVSWISLVSHHDPWHNRHKYFIFKCECLVECLNWVSSHWVSYHLQWSQGALLLARVIITHAKHKIIKFLDKGGGGGMKMKIKKGKRKITGCEFRMISDSAIPSNSVNASISSYCQC
jgi:hypothetical protein